MQSFVKDNNLPIAKIVLLSNEERYLERLVVTYCSNQDKLSSLSYLAALSIYNLSSRE